MDTEARADVEWPRKAAHAAGRKGSAGVSRSGPSASESVDAHGGALPLLRQTSTLRGVFFVGANLAGFMAVSAFLYYLSSGRWLDFTVGSYRRALAVPLSDILVRPLSMFAYPWMIVVAALVLAAVVFIPVMVAVLYRQWVSVLFVLAVAVFAHSPVLAGCLAVGCVIAGQTRLRGRLPFLTLLLGLATTGVLYLVLYYLFFSRGRVMELLPLQRAAFYLPVVLALVAVVLAGASVLGLARLTRYRPGVIWPALFVLLVAPLWLFYEKIGPAELDYALIAGQVEPGETVLRGPGREAGGTGRPASPVAVPDARDRFRHQREAMLGRCRQFLGRRPRSRQVPAVMWIMAVLKDVRLRPAEPEGGRVELEYRGPSDRSVGLWTELVEKHPGSAQAAAGHYRLAVLALRQERIERGDKHLRAARSLLTTRLDSMGAAPPAGLWEQIFVPRQPLPGLEYYRAVLEEVRRLLWLVEANKVIGGGQKDVTAFAEYIRLRPLADADPKRLRELVVSSEKTALADNFQLQAAMAEADRLDRAKALAALAEGVSDSAIVANYELGRLALAAGDEEAWAEAKLKSAEEYFKIVVNAPENPYRAPAEQHLAWLALPQRPAPAAGERP